MTDDRAEMQAARAAGLQKRHEQRLENATYTAAEVKVLTEAALRLGRKEALDDVGRGLGRVLRTHATYVDIQMDSGLWQEIADAASGRTDPEAQSDICRRCFHTAHEDVGECRVCYCRSTRALGGPS